MRSLLAGLAFLTRFPVGLVAAFDGADVSRSSAWFPFIGLLLGAVYCAAAALLKVHLAALITSALLICLDALLTGGLHFDGLADSADGFGGGGSREDILSIMRDHAIGSYGGLALTLVVGLKIALYGALLQHTNWMEAVLLTPALGRWSILLLTAAFPYARPSASVAEGMRTRSLVLGTGIIVLAVAASRSGRAWLAIAAVLVLSLAFGLYCRRRIGGITGDTLGANVELCESAALLIFLWAMPGRSG